MIECSDKAHAAFLAAARVDHLFTEAGIARSAPVIRGIARLLVMADLAYQAGDVLSIEVSGVLR